MQLRLIEMTLLRILAIQLEAGQEERWWPKPPWYRQKKRGSLRDVKRLLKAALGDFSQVMSERSNCGKVVETITNKSSRMKQAA
jgi:hypothetical protein